MKALTPFPSYDDDENEKWRSVLGMAPLTAPALSDPAMQPQAQAPAADSTPPGMEHFAAMVEPNFDAIGSPPQATGPDKGQLALAMFADLILNRGRSMGPLVGAMAQGGDAIEKENYDRRMSDAVHRTQMARAMRAGHLDPQQEANRKRALDLQSRGLDLQAETLGLRKNASTGAREAAIALGADPEMLEGMTDAQVNAWKSAITSQLRQQGSNTAWEHRQDRREQTTINAEGRRPAVAAAVTTATTKARQDATIGTADEGIENFEAANPRLTVTEPGTFRTIASNPRTAARRQQELSTATRALDASQRLRELDREYAKIPMLERGFDKARALAAEYDQLVNEHQGIIVKIAGNSGTGQERAEVRSGLPSIYNPLASARLQGIEKMLHLNVAANLTPYGIGIRGETQAQPISRETQAPGPGVTNGAPPIPTNPASVGWKPPNGMPYLPVGNQPSDAMTRPATPAEGPAQGQAIRMRDPATGWEADVPLEGVGAAWRKGLRPIQ